MKIGFDAKRAFFNRSGLGNYSRWFIDALTQFHSEHEYYLYKLKSDSGVSFKGEKNCRVVTPERGLYKFIPNLWRTSGITFDIKRDQLDIFHGLSHELPIGIQKTGVKSIVTMHDAIFMRYPHLFDTGYRTIFRKKYKHALNVADGIIAISQQSKADIVEYFNTDASRINVIYQGCNPIFYETASDESKQKVKEKYQLPDSFILYVGTIEPRKNLLGIFEALVKENIDIPVVAVGRATKYLEKIKDFVKANQIDNQAIFLHNVETPELPSFYQMSTLFVYPSLFEGFGIPILEALNSGTPVVTTKGSCFPEVGGEAAQYAEYGNSDELGSVIKSVLNSSEVQVKMATKGKEQAIQFREEKVTGQLISYYRDILSH